MDFSKQYHIKGKAWEANCDEKSLSSKTYQRDKVCQWLAVGQWFSSGTPVSSAYKSVVKHQNPSPNTYDIMLFNGNIVDK
jgi:hypothetical protein